MKSIAKTISSIFNPIAVICLAPYYLIYITTHDASVAFYWTLYAFIFLLSILFFVIIGVKKKFFSDLDISTREQRKLIYLIAFFCAFLYLISLFIFHAPYVLYILTIATILTIFFLSIINRKIKASIHLVVITAFITHITISYGHIYLLLLFIIPLVAWARLTVKRHTLIEIITGGTVGGILAVSLVIAQKIFLNR